MSQNTGAPENTKIPVSLLYDTIDLLQTLSYSNFDDGFRACFDAVLSAFQQKKDSMALRDSYAKIVFAKTEEERFQARMLYLQERQKLKGDR